MTLSREELDPLTREFKVKPREYHEIAPKAPRSFTLNCPLTLSEEGKNQPRSLSARESWYEPMRCQLFRLEIQCQATGSLVSVT